ncbi:uncharacterized protein ASCRUDRAFT_77407 [Ascoidea rubescens DSM 1968]|uniref:Uncharacterized protein n=1 Tax=Ascoidea rubescens DSM 1968 TaxID=1344418 RepID=A0A1D2VBJ4_9ASCO|nr:hypothetical protein ASCRUDRAFT_77407 [Ascoidea rubescens DSM 1968]ODV58989.1 hypothetical protein ASCRUDRAFT_77407 [Ascoidea rubescens DSM 1968]
MISYALDPIAYLSHYYTKYEDLLKNYIFTPSNITNYCIISVISITILYQLYKTKYIKNNNSNNNNILIYICYLYYVLSIYSILIKFYYDNEIYLQNKNFKIIIEVFLKAHSLLAFAVFCYFVYSNSSHFNSNNELGYSFNQLNNNTNQINSNIKNDISLEKKKIDYPEWDFNPEKFNFKLDSLF